MDFIDLRGGKNDNRGRRKKRLLRYRENHRVEIAPR